jgi:hypothetical protein
MHFNPWKGFKGHAGRWSSNPWNYVTWDLIFLIAWSGKAREKWRDLGENTEGINNVGVIFSFSSSHIKE